MIDGVGPVHLLLVLHRSHPQVANLCVAGKANTAAMTPG
jgi:hypothetical protein